MAPKCVCVCEKIKLNEERDVSVKGGRGEDSFFFLAIILWEKGRERRE